MPSAQTEKVTWSFRPRFRRSTYGWKGSKLAISRIGEAIAEIKTVARRDQTAGAQGAVLFFEILSPALAHIDSSSGALGNATHSAVIELVPLIAQAPVSVDQRKKWLERLFDALAQDDPPYLESLQEYWGELCASPELASQWADQLLPTVLRMLDDRANGRFAYFRGTIPCLSALLHAKRHEELLHLLNKKSYLSSLDSIWGARVLLAQGQVDEAITYLRERSGKYLNETTFARFAENALLEAGRRAEAFDQYALLANQANSNLSTYRALHKKYPEIAPEKLLSHLISASPTAAGKWFATAKTLGQIDLANDLIWRSPCDPLTLTRAARDFETKQPEFALQCARGALHWMSAGYGYELVGSDVVNAWQLAMSSAKAVNKTQETQAFVDKVSASSPWMKEVMKGRG